MKISASIYSNKNMPLKALINELDSVKIDMLHIDFNDEKTEINKIKIFNIFFLLSKTLKRASVEHKTINGYKNK